MSTLTPRLSLTKPAGTENYSVPIVNANNDIIDTAVGNLQDGLDAEEAALLAYKDLLGYVAWTDVSGEVSIRANSAGAAAPGSSISVAKAMKIGKTVFFMGNGSAGTGNVVDCTVMLPPSMGTPVDRLLACGNLYVTIADGTAPSDQAGIARMTADKLRIVVHADTGGFRDAPASSVVSWSVMYQVP